MGSLQHPVGGRPTGHAAPGSSFRDALISTTSPKLFSSPDSQADPSISTAGKHKGYPAITFSQPHVSRISAVFKWALVGKFSKGYNKQQPHLGRPSVETLQKYFESLDFKGQFQIGLMDNRHLLIQFQLQDDFLHLYSRPVWYVKGLPMRIFKWSPQFHVEKEPPLAPVWITFYKLPVHFFERSSLFAIASLLGAPLRIDSATASLKRPSVARIQIELDLLKDRPEKIWIASEGDEGFWQSVEYEHVPPYCQHCWHIGHKEILCHIHNPELRPANISKKQHATRDVQPKKQVYIAINSPPQQSVPASDVLQRVASEPPQTEVVASSSQSQNDLQEQPPGTVITATGATTAPVVAVTEVVCTAPTTVQHDIVHRTAEPLALAEDEVIEVESPSGRALLRGRTSSDAVSVDSPVMRLQGTQLQGADPASLNMEHALVVHLPTLMSESTTPPSVVETELLPATERGVHMHGTVDEQLHGPVHPQCPSDIEASQQQQAAAQHKPPDVSAFLDLLPPIGQPQIEDSPPVTTSNVLYTVSLAEVSAKPYELVAQRVSTTEHGSIAPTNLNPHAEAFQFPTPQEAYGSQPNTKFSSSQFQVQDPITLSYISGYESFPNEHATQYNVGDYYCGGVFESDLEDEESSYDITDGSEGTVRQKRRDQQKSKAHASFQLVSKEDFEEQSRSLGKKIRKRGRPPGSRNRTFFDVVRTMETRASKSTSS